MEFVYNCNCFGSFLYMFFRCSLKFTLISSSNLGCFRKFVSFTKEPLLTVNGLVVSICDEKLSLKWLVDESILQTIENKEVLSVKRFEFGDRPINKSLN